jgi:phospholipid/cholesterol/gamma-HCH transport system ATP-binding protein
VLTLRNIGKRFGEDWIFRNISLEVSASESIVILGPSGSGKSVLLKIMAGLLPESEGSLSIWTGNIGMLFQKNALFDSLSIEDNLIFPLRERFKMSRAEASVKTAKFLDAVGLAGNEKLFPNEISGGMQKRLGIARALVIDPDLIFYDEPTAGLDPITSKLIADLIQKLRRERKSTLVTVTNDIHRAYQLGERIFLLAKGRLFEGGTPEEVQKTQLPELKQFVHGLQTGPLT